MFRQLTRDHTKSKKRLDIQGLRFIAIVAVLWFHIWPDIFPNGFLGVDMFFVLSGYLMYTILSSKPLNTHSVSDFYYRRIKRILPTYFSLVLSSLLIGFYTFHPSEYPNLHRESLPAVTLTSNIFNLPELGYFANNNLYNLFLHTWSLSVEFQFYLLCPWLFYCFTAFGHTVMVMVWTSITVASFVFQWMHTFDTNVSHMNTSARLWQFLAGFAVAIIKQYLHYIDSTNNTISTKPNIIAIFNNMLTKLSATVYNTKTLITTCLLIPLLFINHGIDIVKLRLWVTVITAALIVHDKPTVFSHYYCVYIGDISYSAYLLHWPIIKLIDYSQGSHARSVLCGAVILLLSVQLGDWVEKAFIKIGRKVTTWLQLLSIIVPIFISVLLLRYFIVRQLDDTLVPNDLASNIKHFDSQDPSFISLAEHIYHRRAENLSLTTKELVYLNQAMAVYNDWYYTCFSKVETIKQYGDSYWTDNFQFASRFEGKGEYEVVVIGNSVARAIVTGLRQLWNHKYKVLTIAGKSAEVPFKPLDLDILQENKYLKFLQTFNRTIDIVMVQHTYFNIPDLFGESYVSENMTQDIYDFYRELEKIPTKAVMIGLPEVISEANLQYSLSVLQRSQSYDKVSIDWKVSALPYRTLF
ncbi:unnamed protein product [Bursaphelenchus okinawaensis]|uniref:Acyltransferase 3 domain-containing protein n=1 Tax=Bursaphelenchus okinawaensis TaxID=465554 RepID=A0A811KRN4_9BILA|nr:unnamed protein product [Bursaphelenchus okinawaensis]CAG9109956.1 unnamed protein product [Bursaphelenchus okinawaensis]